MIKTTTLTAFTTLLLLTSCGSAPEVESGIDTDMAEKTETAVKETIQKETRLKAAFVTLETKDGSQMMGKVTFTEVDGVVSMDAKLKNAVQGEHAIHIHEFGDCSSADGKSAGGHWNPTGEDHGKWGIRPFHRGDIGNFKVDKNGEGKMAMATELWCLGCDDATRNIIGKSIIIHAGKDDCTSQPSGAAGARIACGEITMN